jgi:multiple sugar transport system permease protein
MHAMARPAATARARRRGITLREEVEFFLFVGLWLIGFLVFNAGPILATIVLSFTQWSMVKAPVWIGLSNYVTLITNDPLFYKALLNTIYYTGVSVPLGMILALLIAMLMNQKVRGIYLFRTIFYLPSVISGVAVAILWAWLFHPQFGLINFFLGLFGIQGPEWLFSLTWSMPAMIIMSLWSIGGSMLIYLAGLQSVPGHLYEAAAIDGAGVFTKFRHVTIPLISPVIFFNLVLSIIGSFQVFTNIYVMTQGGPANSTLVYVIYLYQKAFQDFNMGYASALAWILFLVIMFFTAIQFIFAPRWVYYEGEQRR